jgi:hypothetical protein
VIAGLEWLTGVSAPVLALGAVLCVLVDVQVAAWIGRLVKAAVRQGDELGRGGFGLVSPRLARRVLRLVARFGRRLLVAPWVLFGFALVLVRLGVWAPLALVLAVWLRVRHRRF